MKRDLGADFVASFRAVSRLGDGRKTGGNSVGRKPRVSRRSSIAFFVNIAGITRGVHLLVLHKLSDGEFGQSARHRR